LQPSAERKFYFAARSREIAGSDVPNRRRNHIATGRDAAPCSRTRMWILVEAVQSKNGLALSGVGARVYSFVIQAR
jgi:hypothetical protein